MINANEPSRIPSWLFCLVLSILPISFAFRGLSTKHGFLGLPRFGEAFREQAMELVKELAPPARPNDVGYDGQFYAQIALDPTLRNPELRDACDNLSYRAKRIALPCLAFVLGAGRPWYVLQIYSILNIAFWFALLVVLLRKFEIASWKDRLLVIGIVWNAGCLISISRALTDLPALCLAVMAVCEQRNRSSIEFKRTMEKTRSWLTRSVIASLAVLTKETAILSVASFVRVPFRCQWKQTLATISMVLVPISLWTLYVRYQVGPDMSGLGNFAFPFYGFVHKIFVEWRKGILEFPTVPLLEMIAPWSVAVQVCFLFRNISWQSHWWRFGIGFAILAIMLSPWVWATQSAYSRCLLPLAVSFNVLLGQSSTSRSTHGKWWVAGNLGFLDRAAIGILLLLLAEVIWRRYFLPIGVPHHKPN